MWVFLQARMMMPRESDLATLAQTTVSFSMVRHPFERIVSAFRDKFETGQKNNWMYKMYAGDILNVTNLGTPKDEIYLSSAYRKLKNQARPTFAQFISYLLRTPVYDYNDHWAPFWLHCHLCSATNRSRITSNIRALDGKTSNI